ncbi:MAG: APC family permease [Planctomycetota bacterium]
MTLDAQSWAAETARLKALKLSDHQERRVQLIVDAASPEQPTGNSPATTGLVPVLGLFDSTMLVMGCIVGAGIFSAPQEIARATPNLAGILGLWAAGGLLAITGALVFAELGARLPHAGGQYVYLREAFGHFVAYLYGWLLLAAICSSAIAYVATVFTEHFEAALVATMGVEPFGSKAKLAIAAGLIAALTMLNRRGVKFGARVHNAAMISKIVGIVLVIVAGALVASGFVVADPAAAVDRPAPLPASHATQALFAALLSVAFAYGGWQNVAALAGEMRAPQRTMPRAILLGTAVVVVLYVGLNGALAAILTPAGVGASSTPVATAFGAVAPNGVTIVSLLVMLSTFAITHALIMATPRIYFAMARDGVFLRAAGRVHPVHRTPAVAIALQGGFAIAHLFFGDKLSLLQCATLVDWLAFALCGIGLFVLRRRQLDAHIGFRTPGYPWVPGIFVACAGIIIVSAVFTAELEAVLRAAVILAVGVVIYWLSRAHDRRTEQEEVSARSGRRAET